MNRRTAYFFGVTSLLAAGCSVLPVRTSQKEYATTELRVDNAHSRTYVGSESEAIKRMMDEACSSQDEDAWMEVKEPSGRTYFVDIGKDAGTYLMQFLDSKTGKVAFEIPRKRIEPNREKMWGTISSLPTGSKVIFYHIHPMGENDLESYIDKKELPSETDFLADIQTRVVTRQLRPDVEILPERVVGVHGYSEFWTDEEALGIPRIEELNNKANGDLNWSIGTRHMMDISKFENIPPATMEDVIAALNKSGLKIEYRRLRDTPESLKIKEKVRSTK